MARGRMVNKKISNSKRVNDLPLAAQLLYTWLIPHLDCSGVFWGSAKMVKSLVFPRKSCNLRQIEYWLRLMENVGSCKIPSVKYTSDPITNGQLDSGSAKVTTENALENTNKPLIYRYEVNGEVYLWMPGFEGEQVGLRKDKEHPEYPLPPEEIRQKYGKITETFRQNVGVRGREGRGEGWGGTPPSRSRSEENKKVKRITTTPTPPPKLLSSSASEEEIKKEKDVFVLWDEEIGKITSIVRDTLVDAIEHFSEDWVRDAIKEAVRQDKRKWPYIEAILKNWKRDGRDVSGTGPPARDTGKYLKGKYGHMVKH